VKPQREKQASLGRCSPEVKPQRGKEASLGYSKAKSRAFSSVPQISEIHKFTDASQQNPLPGNSPLGKWVLKRNLKTFSPNARIIK